MNLENLKKAAIEKGTQAIKKVIDNSAPANEENVIDADNISSETEISKNTNDTIVTEEEFDDFLDAMAAENTAGDDTDTGRTQKFNLQDVLNKVRRKGEDIYQNSKEFISNAISDAKSDTSQVPADEISDSKNSDDDNEVDISADVNTSPTGVQVDESVTITIDEQLRETKELSENLNTSIEEFKTVINNNMQKIEEQIISLSYKDQDIEGLKNELKKHVNSNANSTAAINGKMSAIEIKLNEISNSLSGISKLNDSIFDLKNAQMNSKNSLEELSKSFINLKKKCIAGVTVLSIITVLILIMEVINLLS